MATQYDVGVSETFTTIQAAIDAIPADLSGGGLQDVSIEAGTYNENVNMLGFSNGDASNHIRVRAKTGDEHGGIFETGVIIDGGGVSTGIFWDEPFTEIIDIQCTNSGARTNMAPIGGDNHLILRCLTKGGRDGIAISASTTIVLCISKDSDIGMKNNAGTGNFYGCLAYGNDENFLRMAGVMNCFNSDAANAQVGDDYTGTIGGSNNTSEDATAKGTSPLINQSIASRKFVSAPTDFHILQDSILQLIGADQAAVYVTDMDQESIPLGEYPGGPDYLAVPAEGGGGTSGRTGFNFGFGF